MTYTLRVIPNMGLFDRAARLLVAESLGIVAFFWLSGVWMQVAYVFVVLLLVTALWGYCPLYTLVHISTHRTLARPRILYVTTLFLGVAFAYGGITASDFFTKKFFLENFNTMNGYYKQTLFSTGQGQREESLAAYHNLLKEYAVFSDTYATYRPYVLRDDIAFSADVARAQRIISDVGGTIESGDLHEAHLALEDVRPIFQEVLKRNGISLLAVALVDFHDSMENVLSAADAKDASAVKNTYVDAGAKLRSVEETVNDAEIQAIRANLETVRVLAEKGTLDALPDAGAALKASFVKVYLARG
ncbi:MAG: DUF2892 domain-containing protein [Candidatus Pacebacteria bacterium]|nr:DUF2892 domain-containing protein [Candidatus Paceibacterota bacterium]